MLGIGQKGNGLARGATGVHGYRYRVRDWRHRYQCRDMQGGKHEGSPSVHALFVLIAFALQAISPAHRGPGPNPSVATGAHSIVHPTHMRLRCLFDRAAPSVQGHKWSSILVADWYLITGPWAATVAYSGPEYSGISRIFWNVRNIPEYSELTRSLGFHLTSHPISHLLCIWCC